ncbi:MAG: hypothetical protein JWO67_3310 [Streptosporangiaceae bacterium]|nr:hypothetical protein [Streptosporangiaceae bacterium]
MSVSPMSVDAPSPTGYVLYVSAIQAQLPLVISVPEAGRLARMTRTRAYLAAQEGAIPTIRVGHRLRVPTARWLDVLGLSHISLPAMAEDAA